MTAKQKKAIRNGIINHCKGNGTYIDAVTDVLIDEIFVQITTRDKAQLDVDTRGQMINVSKDEDRPYYNPIPAQNIVFQADKIIQGLYRQLGISPDVILKLKVDDSKNALQQLKDILHENE